MLNIIVKTLPDDQQRYNTVGDYFIDENGNRTFVVSDMKDWRYEFLVVFHEFIENALCKERGITDGQIDEFDTGYEQRREVNDGVSEPGDCPNAPYFREHKFATKMEHVMADELGVDWDEYNKVVEKLMRNKETI